MRLLSAKWWLTDEGLSFIIKAHEKALAKSIFGGLTQRESATFTR